MRNDSLIPQETLLLILMESFLNFFFKFYLLLAEHQKFFTTACGVSLVAVSGGYSVIGGTWA